MSSWAAIAAKTGPIGAAQTPAVQAPTIQLPIVRAPAIPEEDFEGTGPEKTALSVSDIGRQQIEYYFSDKNWHRDEYLRGLAVNGVVPLASLLDFPRLRSLGVNDIETLTQCVKGSGMVRLVGSGGVQRITRVCKAIVLDANALIRGDVWAQSWLVKMDVVCTTVAALSEVRDDASRRRLETLPCRLETREPSERGLNVTRAFARETGDLISLSEVDIGVIAVAYDLEIEHAGTDAHLCKLHHQVKPPPFIAKKNAQREQALEESRHDVQEQANVHSESSSGSRILAGAHVSGFIAARVEEDDGQGWIGPGTFSDKSAPEDDDSVCAAACATADFAMQNVILQMGLRLLSLDGNRVCRTKRFVLRCSACFQLETNRLTRIFCGRCGSYALRKCSIRTDGSVRPPSVSKRRPQGTKYALPKPRNNKTGADRYNGDLLLREDQLLAGIWRQRWYREQAQAKADANKSVFGPDVADALADLDLKPTPKLNVGYGRTNPNAIRGRERRGKKKV